jgi:tetratricopeptide (TPR) repeat protein
MATTVQELKQDVERDISELRQNLDDIRQATEQEVKELRTDIAHFKGFFKAAGLIAVVTAILGALGTWQIVDDRQKLKTLIEEQKTISHANALYEQSVLIDKLETEFSKIASLDSLRDRAEVRQEIRRLSSEARNISEKLKDDHSRSTFFLVGEAVEPFLNYDYQTAIDNLKQVGVADRGRFIYAYMLGLCLLRTGNIKDADTWLATAANLTEARRASMATNLQGLSKLYQWRTSHDPDLIEQSITILETITKNDPDFLAAYTNVACAYAAKGDFDRATTYLKRRRDREAGLDNIVTRIK